MAKSVRWVEEPKFGLLERMYLPAIAQGLATTVRHIFKPQVKTEMYRRRSRTCRRTTAGSTG